MWIDNFVIFFSSRFYTARLNEYVRAMFVYNTLLYNQFFTEDYNIITSTAFWIKRYD